MADRPTEEEPTPVVVRDRRRIDPDTGEVREGMGEAAAAEATEPAVEANPYLEDLQRLKAEFDNYRKRVDRDRQLVVEQAAARVVAELLPVLDDIERAREHGEVEGGFKTVAESLEQTLTRLGLQRFGAVGDAFDPNVHEAVMHTMSPDVKETTVVDVMRSGYLFAERLLRPAMVTVADPEVSE